MAIVNEYRCFDCGLDITDDGRLFYYDSTSEVTVDYLLLMSTVDLPGNSAIQGKISETYCSHCDKYMLVYSIREIAGEVENPCEIIKKGIANRITGYVERLNQLNEIKKRAEYNLAEKENYYVVTFPDSDDSYYSNYLFPHMTKEEVIEDALKGFHVNIDDEFDSVAEKHDKLSNAIILVIDESDRRYDEDDSSDEVNCPECGAETSKYVGHDSDCPRCGGRVMMTNTICYD